MSRSTTAVAVSTAGPRTDADERRRPIVVYVMGAGRSGSTILGVALGNCPEVFYAGELEAWLRRSGVPNFGGAARERFWESVKEAVEDRGLYGDGAWRYIECSPALFRISGWLTKRRMRTRYRATTERLYRAIANSAQATHIVDTSHYPLRARELQHLDVELYIVYLVRDPIAVASSFRRRDISNASKSLLATNAYLTLTHMLSVSVFLRHDRRKRMVVRYEDLLAEPGGTIRQILDWAGISAPPPDLTSLVTGVPFQGNRLLDSETITFRRERPRPAQGSLGVHLTRLVQLPWSFALAHVGPRAAASTTNGRYSR
jgi:Sulfotransferase family